MKEHIIIIETRPTSEDSDHIWSEYEHSDYWDEEDIDIDDLYIELLCIEFKENDSDIITKLEKILNISFKENNFYIEYPKDIPYDIVQELSKEFPLSISCTVSNIDEHNYHWYQVK